MRENTIVNILIYLILGAAVAVYFVYHPSLLSSLYSVDLEIIALLVVLQMLSIIVNGAILRECTLKFHTYLNCFEWIGLSFVTTMGNYFLPASGGMAVRAIYLKKRYSFPYTHFIALLSVNYLIAFTVIGILGVIASVVHRQLGSIRIPLLTLFLCLMLVSVMFAVLPHFKLRSRTRVSKILVNIYEGLHLLRNDRRLIIMLFAYNTANSLINGLSFIIAFSVLSSATSLLTAFLISLLSTCAFVVKLTPSNIGIQETVVSLSSGLLGTGINYGLLAALIIRASMVVAAFSLGPFFATRLTKELTFENADKQ